MRASVVSRLLALLRGEWWLMTVSAACRVVNQTLGIVIPVVAVSLALSMADEGAHSLLSILAVLAGLALIKGLFRYLEQLTGHGVAFRLLARLRINVFEWLQRVEPARLSAERSGDLVARVSGDIDRVEPFYAHTIAPIIAAVAVPSLAVVGLALFVNPLVAVALGAVAVIYLGVVPWIGRRRVSVLGPELRRNAGEAAAAVADLVQGAGEIAVLNAADAAMADVGGRDREAGEVRQSLARDVARRALAGGMLAGAALVGVALLSVLVDLAFRELAISVVVAWTVMTSLRALEDIVPDTEQALAAAARLFELEKLPPQGDGEASPSPGSVEFDRVSVVADGRAILDAVTLSIERGTFLGIVGPSGSGKSTLVSTLVRQWDPTSGEVRVGGSSVSDLSDGELRSQVTVVPQRPDVFHGTIRSNLLIANPAADDDELRTALSRARLLNWVDGLEAGLATPIGERGVGMSGGQLQRLAIARAFLRDPRVLVLDEATSELDSNVEADVLEEVYGERGRRTLIVIAHRMETITSAELIAVMDHGRVVELGTHESLKDEGGLYAALWQRHEDMLV